MLAAVITTVALPEGRASGQTCPSACDASCLTCCRRWKVRATCPSGAPVSEGAYRSFDEAQRAADERSSCAKGDAACEQRRAVCEGGRTATFSPSCDDDDRIAPPRETESSRVLANATRLLTGASTEVATAEKELSAFGQTRILRDKSIPRFVEAVDKVRAARQRLDVVIVENGRFLAADTSVPNARAHDERASATVQFVASAVSAARAVLDDPSMLDLAAEERERRILAAARLREEDEAKRQKAADDARRAREAAVEVAKQRADEAARQNREAEAQRLATQEAARRKIEEQKAEVAANAAASESQKRALGQQKHGSVVKGLTDVDVQLRAALAAVTATLAIQNLSRDERARGQASERRIRAAQAQSAQLRARADSAVQRPPSDALATLSRTEVELTALLAEATAVRAPVAGSAAAANAKEPPPVPTCTVDVLAPAGAPVLVSIDGAKAVAVPAKVRLSSGRHEFVATAGARTAHQSELVICGRASKVSLPAPQ